MHGQRELAEGLARTPGRVALEAARAVLERAFEEGVDPVVGPASAGTLAVALTVAAAVILLVRRRRRRCRRCRRFCCTPRGARQLP